MFKKCFGLVQKPSNTHIYFTTRKLDIINENRKWQNDKIYYWHLLTLFLLPYLNVCRYLDCTVVACVFKLCIVYIINQITNSVSHKTVKQYQKIQMETFLKNKQILLLPVRDSNPRSQLQMSLIIFSARLPLEFMFNIVFLSCLSCNTQLAIWFILYKVSSLKEYYEISSSSHLNRLMS